MPRFFVDKKDILEDEIKITGDNYRHLTGVLRAKIGDEIEVCNGEKRDYLCKIISINSECVIANVLSDFVSIGEPKCNITLLMAMPKGDKAELIIEKATELGVFKIVFFISKFCVSRPCEKDFLKKQIRYKKVAESAAKQSKRGIVPEILFLDSIKKAVNFTDVDNDKIIFYEGKASPIKEVLKNISSQNISIMIGSEGGFDKDEVTLAENAGFKKASLGTRILRCETAPISAISIILYEKE